MVSNRNLAASARFLGADRILWATDYPHPACTWPDSRMLVEEEFEGLPLILQSQELLGDLAGQD